MPISIDKCHGADNFCYNLEINNQALPNVLSARDLGIAITRNLSPAMHVNDIVSCAHKRFIDVLFPVIQTHCYLLILFTCGRWLNITQ